MLCIFTFCAAAGLIGGCALSQRQVTARNGMVVSAHPLASEIGVGILKGGGNAIDAAVAVGFALAVTYPEAGNIGGGGFMVIRAPDGTSCFVDFREVAPRAATRTMYASAPETSVDGPLASGVPGTVAGFLTAHGAFGRLPLRELLQPSIDLASRGVVVDSRLASDLEDYSESLKRYPSTTRIFFTDGHPLREGDTLVQAELGRTLERIRDGGRDGFYRGRTAEIISSRMAAEGGLIDTGDLSGYRPVIRPSVRGMYRGYEIIAPGLPSSGGLCLLKALQLLEPFNLREAGYHSEQSIHLIAESLKRVFSMRADSMGDPDFFPLSVGEVLDSSRGRTGPYAMNPYRAVPSDSLGGYPGPGREATQTTHYSVIDRDGMAVAVTYTLNDLFGSKEVVDGAGFFLNDEMDDFVTVPGAANMYGLVGGEPNMVEPGKRPLSSMTPVIMLRDGRPVMILGARGGSRIISAVLQVILNIVDFDLPPLRAVDEPRVHHQWWPDTLRFEQGALSPVVAAGLQARGHRLEQTPWTIGQVEAIFIDPSTGSYVGAPDPREGGVAVGY